MGNNIKILYKKNQLLTKAGIRYVDELPRSIHPSGSSTRRLLLKCICGKHFGYSRNNIKFDKTFDCGCGKISFFQKHGMAHTMIRKKWARMKSRCLNPNHHAYIHYGGRGISVYTPWLKDFLAFYYYVSKLEGYGNKELSLDRIDNDGNYEPGNLRWATRSQQMKNRRYKTKSK